MIGTPHVEILGTAGQDITCLVDEVNIRHGRGDTTGQPPASTATFNLSLNTADGLLPTAIEVGATIRVRVTLDGPAYSSAFADAFDVEPVVDSVRFYGRITDVAIGWDDAGEETPHAVVAQVQAAGPLSDLGRRVVGDTPWPQELDGARVARILSNAGMPTAGLTDPGTVLILFGIGGNDVHPIQALPAAQAIADDALGVLWETRTGEVRYADANHRRTLAWTLYLDDCDLLVTPTWIRNTDGLVNLVSIGYGASAEVGGADQAHYVASAPNSQTQFGRYEWTRNTQLVAFADATILGQTILTRYASPAWVLSSLPIAVADLTGTETQALLGLDMHSLIAVTLPQIGQPPHAGSMWVEGWTEHLAAGVHDIELAVSDYCRTAPSPRWDDAPASWTWDAMNLRWDDAGCVDPLFVALAEAS